MADELARCRALGIRVGGQITELAERKESDSGIVGSDDESSGGLVSDVMDLGTENRLEKLLEGW